MALQPPSSDDPPEDLIELQEMGGDIQYSLDDAIEHIGFGVFQIKLTIVIGLAWMADSMEMMVISIISPILLCEWNLPSYKEALVTTVLFLGQGFGSISWGYISDNFGRKKAIYMGVSVIFVFGIASSQAPSYYWMLVLRFLVGIGIGGLPQGAVILTEMLPVQNRGKSIILLQFFWAAGSIIAAAFAVAIINQLNWRYYLIVITSPVFIFLVVAIWLPETPRFLLTTGKYDKLVSLIERMCKTNRKPLPKGNLSRTGQINTKRGRLTDLFKKGWRRTTVLLFIFWFTSTFAYYGIILLTTEMFQTEINGCHPVTHTNTTRALGQCKKLSNNDYVDFMLTSVAEFPGLILTLLIIDRLGRRKSLALQFGLTAISVLLLAICTTRAVTVVFIFLVRGLIAGSFMSVYVYTPEVLPTNVRAVGIGACSLFARLGAMLTPFVAQVLIHESFYYVIIAYFIPLLICVFVSLLLEIETAGRSLSDSSKAISLDFSNNDYESFK